MATKRSSRRFGSLLPWQRVYGTKPSSDELDRVGGFGPGWYAIAYRSGTGWRSPKEFAGPFGTKVDGDKAKRDLKVAYARVEVAKLPNDPFTLQQAAMLPAHLKVGATKRASRSSRKGKSRPSRKR